MTRKQKTYSGTTDPAITARELQHRALARRAAAESFVLLQNDGTLPLPAAVRLAVFGSGALHPIKGGTGSGDVNEREVVSIVQGLANAGFCIANTDWLARYDTNYEAARDTWKQHILTEAAKTPDAPWGIMDVYVHAERGVPVGALPTAQEMAAISADTAIYIVSRLAGEGADRRAEPGDYYLTDEEQNFLTHLRAQFPHLILALNTGGPVDLGFIDSLPVNALLQLCQPGMECGNAFADVVSGKVNPCGKMADTWAHRYEDFPCADSFGHRNGDVAREEYREGIYVGYRYFDTFGIAPRVAFGFGLSYTTFSDAVSDFRLCPGQGDSAPEVALRVTVTNTGNTYAGREIVQVYARCPQTALFKEAQRLCAFGKTPLLAPGQSCVLTLAFSAELLASFDPQRHAYLLEAGDFTVCVGASSAQNEAVGVVRLPQTLVLRTVKAICPLAAPLAELTAPTQSAMPVHGLPVAVLTQDNLTAFCAAHADSHAPAVPQSVTELVDSLSHEQLLSLTSGDPGKGQDTAETFGSSGVSVPGSAGETHGCVSGAPWHLASIVLADGPAGLRLSPEYRVRADGSIIKPSFVESIEHGLFARRDETPNCTVYHQYCTAFPVGSLLAQSWDTQLLHEVGSAIATEMDEFGITLWLAPGMNLHRNPLCGRNFEYYSEDPLLTGVMAAAITKGVQESGRGVGTTIKHFACNNLEDNRKRNDSIVSERALRELYLRGFEIAVRSAQPMALMTSYNLLNGVHTANSHDLITTVLREEWGFAGLVMTDWTTTGDGGSSPVGCMKAGNDLIMPGSFEDLALLRSALTAQESANSSAPALSWQQVKQCVARLAQIILQSSEYEGSQSYARQFGQLIPFVRCLCE